MSEDEKSANVDGSVPARLIKNTLSQIGLAVAVIAFANIVFLFLVDLISTTPNPYIGVLTYMVMPGFLLFGLLMVVVGALLERRRRFKGQKQGEFIIRSSFGGAAENFVLSGSEGKSLQSFARD